MGEEICDTAGDVKSTLKAFQIKAQGRAATLGKGDRQ